MAGRIESYIHSDGVTPNKGGAIVEVTCGTDFGAKSDEFIAFAKLVARMAFAFDCQTWDDLVNEHPMMAEKKVEVEKAIGEKVGLRRVARMTLTPDYVIEDDEKIKSLPPGKTVVRGQNGKIIGIQG